VRDTRAASPEALQAQSLVRLQALMAQGVTTVEIKSGYGLALESERQMLQVARALGRELPVSVCTTFLGAHAVPPEFAGRSDDYVDAVLAMLAGGFVAGIRAGFSYNTFPLMDGRLVPDGYWDLAPALANFTANIAAVQFNHRLLATAVLVVAVIAGVLAWRRLAPGFARGAVLALAGAADMMSGLFRSIIWNETVPNEMRGRLAGAEMISYLTGPLLGNARAGYVAAFTSVQFSLVSGGLLCVAGVLGCAVVLRQFWQYVGARADAGGGVVETSAADMG
jgi:hypothetical protein